MKPVKLPSTRHNRIPHHLPDMQALGALSGNMVAATDGSIRNGKIGYGAVIAEARPDGTYKVVEKKAGICTNFPESRNITGEVTAPLFVLKWCDLHGIRNIKIIFDYKGVEKWATGEWTARSGVAKWYVESLKRYRHIYVTWEWVKGHTGCPLNEIADKLAASRL